MASVEEMKKVVTQKAEPKLAYIFEQEEVELQLQYDLVNMGMKTIRKMAVLEDDHAAVRKLCKDV